MFVGSYKTPVSPSTAHGNVKAEVQNQGVQTYGLDALLAWHLAGQFNSVASRYSTGLMAGIDLLSDKRL